MKLVTVAEYAKQEGISVQGVSKRVASGLVQSVKLDDNLTYIVVVDTSVQVIKEIKSKVKLLNANIRTLKEKVVTIQHREDYVKRLEHRVDMLEKKLDDSTTKKEELYEKVINTLALPKR